MQNKITIHGMTMEAEIDFPSIKFDNTIRDLCHTVSDYINFPSDKIRCIINNTCCNENYKLKDYRYVHPFNKMHMVLISYTPRDIVYVYRTMAKLKGFYQPVRICVKCNNNHPNVANSLCRHDAILCYNCAFSLKVSNGVCPECKQNIHSLENIAIESNKKSMLVTGILGSNSVIPKRIDINAKFNYPSKNFWKLN